MCRKECGLIVEACHRVRKAELARLLKVDAGIGPCAGQVTDGAVRESAHAGNELSTGTMVAL